MHKNIPIVVGITILFLGLAIQPSIATVQPETDIDIEPKDYLFQTIIDIANNPDVKNLLEKYKPDLFKVDIDRSIYRKIFFRNPRLLFNTLFTKPTMSIEYLNKCYDKGIEITNILREDKVIEIFENVEKTDVKLFDELNNIITNDDELSKKLEILKEINKELNPTTPWKDTPIICSIFFIILTALSFLIGILLVKDYIYLILKIFEIFPITVYTSSLIYIPIAMLWAFTMVCFTYTLGCLSHY